jgi:Zn-dependent protease/CBS domain-containing protein
MPSRTLGGPKLLTVRGITIRVHWLLIVMLPLFAWVMAADYFGAGAVPTATQLGLGAALAVVLFASVSLHELAHSLVATSRGVVVREIVLLPIGGVSELEGRPRSSRDELAIAAAGPLSSLLLGVGLDALSIAWPSPLLAWSGYLNVSLGLFNLLVPAFPMDGGRVLRALLTPRYGLLGATHRAARLGRIVTFVMGVLGLLTLPAGLWLILIALFIYAAGSAEENAVQTSAVLQGYRVSDIMTSAVVAIPAGASVQEAVLTLRSTRHVAFPVVRPETGGLVGIVRLDDLARVPASQAASVRVDSLVHDLPVTASPDEPADEALARIMASGNDHLAVIEHERLAGFVSRADYARFVQIALAFAQEGARGRSA